MQPNQQTLAHPELFTKHFETVSAETSTYTQHIDSIPASIRLRRLTYGCRTSPLLLHLLTTTNGSNNWVATCWGSSSGLSSHLVHQTDLRQSFMSLPPHVPAHKHRAAHRTKSSGAESTAFCASSRHFRTFLPMRTQFAQRPHFFALPILARPALQSVLVCAEGAARQNSGVRSGRKRAAGDATESAIPIGRIPTGWAFQISIVLLFQTIDVR